MPHAALVEVSKSIFMCKHLEHMAAIHLGIGLINILNLLNKKSLFRAGKPLAKERIFASHPRVFVFTITTLEDELFPQGYLQKFFLQIRAHPYAGY